MTPCIECQSNTNRADGYCPNCAAILRPNVSEGERTYITQFRMDEHICQDCGHSNHNSLMLLWKNPLDTSGKGIPAATGTYEVNKSTSSPYVAWQTDPDLFIIRCRNCQSRFHKSAGRPPIYDQEERVRRYYHSTAKNTANTRKRQNDRVLDACGHTCSDPDCGGLATRVIWIGQKGLGPKHGESYSSRNRILREAEYRANFAPYCADHPRSRKSPRKEVYEYQSL